MLDTILHSIITNRKVASILYPKHISIFEQLNDNVLLNKTVSKKDPRYKNLPVPKKHKHDYLLYVHENFIQNKPIDYLEFGVNEGESILTMAKLNTNPQSRFFGFDTFTGYPEKIDGAPADCVILDGSIPKTDDKRIQFIKGLFQDTLPDFISNFTPKSQLVILMDPYFYSATLYCLTKLDHLIKSNSIITFWAFGRLRQESRAFYDYTRAYYRDYAVLCSARNHCVVTFLMK